MGRVLTVFCTFAFTAILAILIMNDRYGYIGAEQFEKLQTMCEKNGGLSYVQYQIVLEERGDDSPLYVFCNNRTRFEVPDEIKNLKLVKNLKP